MINLDKKHDPKKNAFLIKKYQHTELSLKKALNNTEALFNERSHHTNRTEQRQSIFNWIKLLTKRTLVKNIGYKKVSTTQIRCDSEESIYPEWKKELDDQYLKLLKELKEEVNVKDYGAIGDGVADDTEAFKKAIGRGRVIVRVPEGIYVTKGIKLPSWTCLIGEGKRKSVLKLHDQSPKSEWLITNKNHLWGNNNILVKGLSLDWNIERLGAAEKTSAGNNRSSCLTFANVKYGWIHDIEAINPGLHCFDVSSSVYTYLGDGTLSRGGSKYIWLDNLNGYGFGDDGITTHHSSYIFISNSHMCDPSGRSHKKGFSNSNGIEIDDGSQNVWLLNNSTARCFGGLEIKAHHNASAASNVHIIGHLSVNDNRSYNFRHIGHHKDVDPESKTAFHISATNIVAVAPIFTDLYKDSTPRGLVVSGYNHVLINHFTLIGDPLYDYKKNPVIAIQYRARNVMLQHVSIKDFTTAGPAIKVYGGTHRADEVVIQNITCDKYFSNPIEVGTDVKSAVIDKVNVYA
ncbi:glycoside hydrolase family 55 protein [Fictibacillus halophilus]|uniref:glycoside hydrolase family 55 protein n=1 Tax=Fictibacillus halophilus TaxID=1610490 RepID=UPI001CFB843A|nr:glycoside hydrolase family 55 protein [Fictibacillus halophilus]